MSQAKLHGKNIEIGDSVWSIRNGWVFVANVWKRKDYVITTSDGYTYTQNGNFYEEDSSPSLFWKEQLVDLSKPLPNLKVNQKVIVWDDNSTKYYRHFYDFEDNGNIVTFKDGTTSWSSTGVRSWENYEVLEDE